MASDVSQFTVQPNASSIVHGLALFCTATMLLYAAVTILDPTRGGWGTWQFLPLRYGAVLLALAGMFFFLVGGVKRSALQSTAFASIVLFAAYEISGGAAALVLLGSEIEDTFLGRGLSVPAAMLGMIIASKPELFSQLRIPTRYVAIVSAFAGAFVLVLFEFGLAFSHLPQALHIELFFVTAGAIWIGEKSRSYAVKSIFAILLLYVAVSSGKATAYLLFALFLFISFFSRGLYRNVTGKRKLSLFRIAVLFLSIPVVIYFAYNIIYTRATAYENDLRHYMWQVRLDQFEASPLVGSGFLGSALVPRPDIPTVGLPTHNDYLDVLSQGGIVGFSLLAAILFVAVRSPLLWDAILGDRSRLSFAHFFAYLFMTWAVASLGNPIFSTPSMAVPVWFCIGVLCARPGAVTLRSGKRAKSNSACRAGAV